MGPPRSGKTTLAARIALETARAGGRVVWFAADGGYETPAFRLLTGLSGVRARAVFVERDLQRAQLDALAEVARSLASLPIFLVDAHGASVGHLARSCAEAAATGPVDLVIADSLAEPDARLLRALEGLSEEVPAPVLAIATEAGALGGPQASTLPAWEPPLLPGSLVLRLDPGTREDPVSGMVPLGIDVHRCGRGLQGRVEALLVTGRRWIAEGPIVDFS